MVNVNESQLNIIRSRRDQLIKASDWTQFSDSPLSVEKKAEFALYRDQLRNVPQYYIENGNIVWPTKPTI